MFKVYLEVFIIIIIRLLTFTPSRQVGGRRVVCLDDRYLAIS